MFEVDCIVCTVALYALYTYMYTALTLCHGHVDIHPNSFITSIGLADETTENDVVEAVSCDCGTVELNRSVVVAQCRDWSAKSIEVASMFSTAGCCVYVYIIKVTRLFN